MKIIDGQDHFQTTLAGLSRGGHLRKLADRSGVTLPALDQLAAVPTIPARIYRNQWIVDCPDCSNAEFGFLDEPIFMCSNCFNGVIGGLWRPVAFPTKAERRGIELALRARAVPHNRNWLPGESASDLRRENKAHGLREVAE